MPTSPATREWMSCSGSTASGSSTRTCHRREPRRRPWRPGTWPMRTCGCATPTTTRCGACSTRWDARCACMRREGDPAGPAAQDVNLSLYWRWLDVQERDPEYAAAQRRLRDALGELQDVYLLRLDYALQAVYAGQRRGGSGDSGAE